VHTPGSVDWTTGAGQITAGGVVSLTVTVNEQEAVFPDPSVAVQVTVVTPLANVDPDAGAHSTVAPGQLSVGVGVV